MKQCCPKSRLKYSVGSVIYLFIVEVIGMAAEHLFWVFSGTRFLLYFGSFRTSISDSLKSRLVQPFWSPP